MFALITTDRCVDCNDRIDENNYARHVTPCDWRGYRMWPVCVICDQHHMHLKHCEECANAD